MDFWIFYEFILILIPLKLAKRGVLILHRTHAADVARGGLTKRFYASLNHKNAGQTKFIKPNSQR